MDANQIALKILTGVAWLLFIIICAFARKDESCEPKSCANCRDGEKRRVILHCVECIKSRGLPCWRPEE